MDLSYSDIAYKILKEDQTKRSLHYRFITQKAYMEGLIENNGIIMASNIASAIDSEIRKNKIDGSAQRFISYGKGKYGLIENEPKGIFKDIRDKNNEVKEKLLQRLLSMPPFDFEELVAQALKNLGFENIVVTSKTGDGGIDVIGELVVAGAIKSEVCVQVKRWKSNVQRGCISELRGSLRPHQTGLFITTSDFSRQAIDEANDVFKTPISLINGKDFVDILCSFGIGVVSEEVVVYEIDENNCLIEEEADFEKDFSVEQNVSSCEIEKDSSIKPDTNNEFGNIEIFANYKGKKYTAIMRSPKEIFFDGEVYISPSRAAGRITNTSVNGWEFWNYIDADDGKAYPISQLRDKYSDKFEAKINRSIIPSINKFDEKGRTIFARCKGKEYYATYISSTRIIYDGKEYKSPSAPAMIIRNGVSVNGWKFWKYIDEHNGNTYYIDKLRQK